MTSTKQFNKAMMAAIFSSGLACLGVGQTDAAVILHGNGITTAQHNKRMPSDFASNVSENDVNWNVSEGMHGVVGAPDITLTWINRFDWYRNWNGRGHVFQLDSYQPDEPRTKRIVFTPDPNSGVHIISFDLDGWAGSAVRVEWEIVGSITGYYTGGTWSRNGGRDTIAPEISGMIGETLTLVLNHVSGSGSYLAIDNIAFDQLLMPEPASAALVTAGVGAMAMRRRRKS